MLYCPNCDEYYQDDDPRIEERNNMMLERCPVCGERVEVFSRAGKLSVDSVCPLCGYRFPAEPQPGFISEKQL